MRLVFVMFDDCFIVFWYSMSKSGLGMSSAFAQMLSASHTLSTAQWRMLLRACRPFPARFGQQGREILASNWTTNVLLNQIGRNSSVMEKR